MRTYLIAGAIALAAAFAAASPVAAAIATAVPAAAASPVAAEVVDLTPLADIAAGWLAAILMAVVTAAVAWLAPKAKIYLDAKAVDAVSEHILRAAQRAVTAAREKYAPCEGSLAVEVKSAIIGDAAGYLASQIPERLRLAGMTDANVQKLAERVLLEQLGLERPLAMDGGSVTALRPYAAGKGGLT